jgi:hypothetical protein
MTNKPPPYVHPIAAMMRTLDGATFWAVATTARRTKLSPHLLVTPTSSLSLSCTTTTARRSYGCMAHAPKALLDEPCAHAAPTRLPRRKRPGVDRRDATHRRDRGAPLQRLRCRLAGPHIDPK